MIASVCEECGEMPCVCPSDTVAGWRPATDSEMLEIDRQLNAAIHELVHASSHIGHDNHDDAQDSIETASHLMRRVYDLIQSMAIPTKMETEKSSAPKPVHVTLAPGLSWEDRVSKIIDLVAYNYNVRRDQILDTRRLSERVAWARAVAMWIADSLTPLSYGELAALFNRKSHATIGHACKKVGDWWMCYPEDYLKVQALRDAAFQLLEASDAVTRKRN